MAAGPKSHPCTAGVLSMNQLPVRLNGAAGRGLARFSGDKALGGCGGITGACCARAAPEATRPQARARATIQDPYFACRTFPPPSPTLDARPEGGQSSEAMPRLTALAADCNARARLHKAARQWPMRGLTDLVGRSRNWQPPKAGGTPAFGQPVAGAPVPATFDALSTGARLVRPLRPASLDHQ